MILYQFEVYIWILFFFPVFCSLWHPEMHLVILLDYSSMLRFCRLEAAKISFEAVHATPEFPGADGRCDYCHGKMTNPRNKALLRDY